MSPLIRALATTTAASLLVACLMRLGLGEDASLAAGLILAAGVHIAGLAALNGAANLPTSPVPIGDIGP